MRARHYSLSSLPLLLTASLALCRSVVPFLFWQQRGTASTDIKKPSPLTDHMPERIDIAWTAKRKIRERWDEFPPDFKARLWAAPDGPFELNLIHSSFFIYMEFEALKDIYRVDGWEIARTLIHMESFLAICKFCSSGCHFMFYVGISILILRFCLSFAKGL